MSVNKNNKKQRMDTVKVGPKGQIVIPKDVRDMFGIEPGDSLIVLSDEDKGIAIHRMSVFSKLADMIFGGKAKQVYPDKPEDESIAFASAVKEIEKKDESGDDDE